MRWLPPSNPFNLPGLEAVMPIRPHLHQWQYADYGDNHRSALNLWLHIVTVPLFWLGLAAVVVAAVQASWGWLALAGVLLLAAFAAQGFGHSGERKAPVPFLGLLDFVSRFLVEQLVTFPRFVLAGGWWKNLRQGHS